MKSTLRREVKEHEIAKLEVDLVGRLETSASLVT